MSFADRFAKGQQIAEKLMDTYQASKRKQKMAEIGQAQDVTENSLTEEQANQIKDLASQTNEDGTPKYTVSFDGSNKYTATPTGAQMAIGGTAQTPAVQAADGQAPGLQPPVAQAAPAIAPFSTSSKPMTSFLGKTYDQPLTEQQRDAARIRAMAGVYDESGDPEQALRLRSQATAAEMAIKQGALVDQQIKAGERSAKAADRDELYQTGRQELFNNSIFGQSNAKFAGDLQKFKADTEQYKQRVAAGDVTAAAPVAPSRPAYGVAESLLDGLTLAAHDVSYGKGSPETMIKLAEAQKNLNDEGYGRALKLAQGGASLDELAKAFNASGKVQFDPAAVVSDKMQDNGAGLKSRVLTIKNKDGSTSTINVMSELDALGKADALFTRMFEQTKLQNDEKRINIAQQGVNIQAGSAKRAGDKDARDSDAAKAAVKAGVALYQQTHPNATSAELEAVRTGVLQAVPKVDTNAPAEVKLANALVAAEGNPKLQAALRAAMSKSGRTPREAYLDMMKPQGGIRADEKIVSEVMSAAYGDNWRSLLNEEGGNGQAVTPPVKVITQADYSKLKSGTTYTAPDGSVRTKH